MQRPYHHTVPPQNQFNSYYDETYRYPLNPMPQYTQQYPFNRNYAPHNQNHNEEHWCDTCDRSFHTLDILEKHKQQHQKCNIDGCQFIAHPKVITKHIQMQHASGLYKKIAKLNNPEEIEKWREERKKRYPTKVNIEKKAAEIKEKIDRGEKMGLSKDRHHRRFNKGNHPNKEYPIENKHQNRRKQYTKSNNNTTLNKIRKPMLPKKVNNVVPNADDLRKLKAFSGIRDIVMEICAADVVEDTNCNFTIEDDDCEVSLKPVQDNLVNGNEPQVCGALSLLMCEYDSSDDDVNEAKIDESSSKSDKCQENSMATHISDNETKIKVNECIIGNDKSDDEGPEEMKIDKCTDKQAVEQTSKLEDKIDTTKGKKKAYIEKKPNRNHFIRPKPKIPSTLLQKLLQREMQQERNIVLQCIRHIVKNNFFDKI